MTLLNISTRKDYSQALKAEIRQTLNAMAVKKDEQLYVFLFTQMYTQAMADWDDMNEKSDIPVEQV